MIGRIKAALRAPDSESARRLAVEARTSAPPAHPRPAFSTLPESEREARLVRCLESQGTFVTTISRLHDLPETLERLLKGENAPLPATRLVMADDHRLTSLDWTPTPASEVWRRGDTLGEGCAALTHAEWAVAETGTLVLTSGAPSPASLAFLPEVHVVVLARTTILGGFEEAFAAVSAASTGRLPRAVNLVSGPSRTGDIGGRIVRGAHGPRRLGVIVYGPLSG